MPTVYRRRAVPRLPVTRLPLRRIGWMINRLRADQPLTAGEAAAEFEVSLRTIYRDLDFARDQLAAPLEYDARQHSYVLTEKTYSLPPLALSDGELLGFFFAEKVVRQYRGTPYEADLKSTLRKIEQSLPDEVTIDPNPLEGFLSPHFRERILREATPIYGAA